MSTHHPALHEASPPPAPELLGFSVFRFGLFAELGFLLAPLGGKPGDRAGPGDRPLVGSPGVQGEPRGLAALQEPGLSKLKLLLSAGSSAISAPSSESSEGSHLSERSLSLSGPVPRVAGREPPPASPGPWHKHECVERRRGRGARPGAPVAAQRGLPSWCLPRKRVHEPQGCVTCAPERARDAL